MTWTPFYIDLDGVEAAVFGGGTVATRRALMLSRAGAKVRVYSLQFTRELEEEASRNRYISLERVDLSSADIEGLIGDALIVVVATSDESINQRILEAAKRMRRLVNYPPDGRRGNLIVPFRGETSYGLHYAITSLGATGIAARRARDLVGRILEEDQGIRVWYEAMSRVKKLLKSSIGDHKLRYRLYFIVEKDPEFSRALERGDLDGALRRAQEIVLQHLQGSSQPQG